MKFTKEKLIGLSGDPEMWWREDSTVESNDPFAVVASPSGVRIQGRSPHLGSQEDLQVFAKTLGDAYTEYFKRLKPRIEMGH